VLTETGRFELSEVPDPKKMLSATIAAPDDTAAPVDTNDLLDCVIRIKRANRVGRVRP
jgi:hypothetical protein